MYRPPPSILRKSSGAFDLPSIITGVVVVGILAAGVLAAIFGVIPFAQDRGAKQDLSSIRTAEGVAKAKDNRFMDHQRLLDVGYLQLSSTEKTKVKADAKGTCYVGIAKSGTGTLFYSTDANTDPQVLETDTDTGCLTEEELAELIDDVGGIEEDTPEGAVKNLKLTAVSPLQAKATWDSVKGATGYKVEYQVEGGDWITTAEAMTGTTAKLNALPEQTVGVKVSALIGEWTSEPATESVKLPDSSLKNPSFERGLEGWTKQDSRDVTTTAIAHTGVTSMQLRGTGYGVSQVVTIPAEEPVLTFWDNGFSAPPLTVNGATVTPILAAAEGPWEQFKADLSAYAGKTVTITIASNHSRYIDDVTLGEPTVPDKPALAAASSRTGTATVTWQPPAFKGGTPITSYTVNAYLGDQKVTSVETGAGQLSTTIAGLKTGSDYTFSVEANNSVGASGKATIAALEILSTAIANPSFERGLEGWTNGDYRHVVSSTMARDGGKSMHLVGTGYGVSQVVTVPANEPVLTYWQASSGNLKLTVGNTLLTPVSAAAVNGWTPMKADLSAYAGKTVAISFTTGNSMYLDDVALGAPTVPDKPQLAAASSRTGTATIIWAPPAFQGGTPIASYTVNAYLEGQKTMSVEAGANQPSATIAGLKAGSGYTFSVEANNSVGASSKATIAELEILSSAIANPSFESGLAGWSKGDNRDVVTSAKARTGGKSMNFIGTGDGVWQVVTVPADEPVLTYWQASPGRLKLTVGGTILTPVSGAVENGWTPMKADLSAYAGKTVTISFTTGNSMYLDDVAFEAKL